MNGLLVTLPLLLLLFSSLYTSHAPILVLKKIARAIRMLLHSWVLNYSGERGTTKDTVRKTVLYNRTGQLWKQRKSHTSWVHHRIICLIFRLGSTEPSCWGKPKLPECNAANTIWVCQLRAGGYSVVCDELAETMLQSDQYRQNASLTGVKALMSASGERWRCQACMSFFN